ncbi:MAG: glycerol-3-phosphate 1-O-acyltransferase PlsY [Burkholderiales bacterium]|nr:glycerol-3-phosphate 1-O-acyltransferase PlsY [Burkholderiales bacterium]
MNSLLATVAAYLIGSLSFAVIVSRLYGLPDPHSYGSGNPGATNVMRTGRKSAALLTLLGDALKGFIVVWLARRHAADWGLDQTAIALVALAVFLGHLFPLYFRFKGGKGVATAAGILFALSGWLGLGTIAVWIVAFYATRISSVGALSAAVAAPLLAWWLLGAGPVTLAVLVMAVLIVWRHKENIRKLRSGREGGFRKT